MAAEGDVELSTQVDNREDERRPLMGQSATSFGGIVETFAAGSQNDDDINEGELRRRLWEHLDTLRKRWIQFRRLSLQVIFQTVKTILVFVLMSLYN